MTSARQQASNRANAQKSTGPRTATGKQRASRNALRHGLSVPVASDPETAARIDKLTALLAGDHQDPAVRHFAREAAEAQLEWQRARRAPANQMQRWVAEAGRAAAYRGPALDPDVLDLVEKTSTLTLLSERPEPEGQSTERKASLQALCQRARIRVRMGRQLLDLLKRAERMARREQAARALDLERQLHQIGRYERRALSRRKTALRALHDAVLAVAAGAGY